MKRVSPGNRQLHVLLMFQSLGEQSEAEFRSECLLALLSEKLHHVR